MDISIAKYPTKNWNKIRSQPMKITCLITSKISMHDLPRYSLKQKQSAYLLIKDPNPDVAFKFTFFFKP